jgi:hypothetical protein
VATGSLELLGCTTVSHGVPMYRLYPIASCNRPAFPLEAALLSRINFSTCAGIVLKQSRPHRKQRLCHDKNGGVALVIASNIASPDMKSQSTEKLSASEAHPMRHEPTDMPQTFSIAQTARAQISLRHRDQTTMPTDGVRQPMASC